MRTKTSAFFLTGLVALAACSMPPPEAIEKEIAAWIARGREQLRNGHPDEALRSFEKARRRSPSFETRMWVLRAWMDQDRSNDTLDAIDALRRVEEPGEHGIELDYLYGMAFARRARALAAAGVADSSVQINFIDAAAHLQRVVDQSGERFPDAYLSLARSAWSNRNNEQARTAAEGAVRAYPEDGDAWLALGRIAISQFVNVHRPPLDELEEPTDEPPATTWSPTAELHWRAGESALRKAVRVLGIPTDESGRKTLARAGLALGHALVWKERFDEAAGAYALSIAFNPDGTDYNMLYAVLQIPAPEDPSGATEESEARPTAPRPEFLRALEAGKLAFHARVGLDDPRDGTLLWWLGRTRFDAGRTGAAEQDFRDSLKKLPEAANAWLYVGLCRYAAGDYLGATQAMRTGWTIDPSAMVKEMQRELELNLAKVDYMIGQVPEERLLDRAAMAELCAETAQDEPRHWNNMALFLRDEADRVRGDGSQRVHFLKLCERSFRAYGRALALTPEDPQLLNDTAVLLHYYLERDYEIALAMYQRAQVQVKERLKLSLSLDDRLRFETAQTDSSNNLRLLRDKMRRRDS